MDIKRQWDTQINFHLDENTKLFYFLFIYLLLFSFIYIFSLFLFILYLDCSTSWTTIFIFAWLTRRIFSFFFFSFDYAIFLCVFLLKKNKINTCQERQKEQRKLIWNDEKNIFNASGNFYLFIRFFFIIIFVMNRIKWSSVCNQRCKWNWRQSRRESLNNKTPRGSVI